MTEEVLTQERLLDIAIFATLKHQGQKRKGSDESPYIIHPLKVAKIIMEIGGIYDKNIITAALLHDTIEDTKTTQEELVNLFGEQVTDIVLEVSDDKTLKKMERKRLQILHAPYLSYEAKVIKLADKLDNCRDILSSPPADWLPRRQQEYIQWSYDGVAIMCGTNSNIESAFDAFIRDAEEQLDFSIEPIETLSQRKWAP